MAAGTYLVNVFVLHLFLASLFPFVGVLDVSPTNSVLFVLVLGPVFSLVCVFFLDRYVVGIFAPLITALRHMLGIRLFPAILIIFSLLNVLSIFILANVWASHYGTESVAYFVPLLSADLVSVILLFEVEFATVRRFFGLSWREAFNYDWDEFKTFADSVYSAEPQNDQGGANESGRDGRSSHKDVRGYE